MTESIHTLTKLPEYEQLCNGSIENPYPLYDRLRREDPVHWNQHLNCWMLSRYEHVLAASRDPRFANDRASVNTSALPKSDRPRFELLSEHVSNWLGFTDPPKHTHMRELVSETFTSDLGERMRGRIQEIVDELILQVEGQGEMDLMGDLAWPLPATVICELLGIPAGDRSQFRTLTEDISSFVGGAGPLLVRAADRAEASRRELTALFRDLTHQRRHKPTDDLISELARVEGKEGGLNEQELLGLCVFLFVAGHETTVGLIGNGMLTLLNNPNEALKLKEDWSLLPTAVEELLRYESPIQIDTRLMSEDVELDDQLLAKGQAIMLMRGAANRDPDQFPDPELFDVGRKDNRHLAFGWGIHFCLGAPLARVEAQVAVRTLLKHFPALRLKNDKVAWWENMAMRSPTSLPVKF